MCVGGGGGEWEGKTGEEGHPSDQVGLYRPVWCVFHVGTQGSARNATHLSGDNPRMDLR